jgi:hypothetical protein
MACFAFSAPAQLPPRFYLLLDKGFHGPSGLRHQHILHILLKGLFFKIITGLGSEKLLTRKKTGFAMD